MQSHDGSINLIPAIPSDWQAGSFKGLKALGGATVDLTWSEGKPVEAKVTAATDGELKVRNKDVYKRQYQGRGSGKNHP